MAMTTPLEQRRWHSEQNLTSLQKKCKINRMQKTSFYTNLLALFAGASLVLAFAPIGWYPFAVLAPALLLFLWQKQTPRSACWHGWLFGVGLFGTGTSWVYVSIHLYGNLSAPLAAVLTALFVMALALFFALQGYAFKRLFPYKNNWQLLIGFPLIWVLFEWLRGWALTGFPWLYLGYSQTNSPLKGFAPVLGAYGLSLLLALSAALLIVLITRTSKQRLSASVAIIAIWLSGALLMPIQWTQTSDQAIQVSLVQGNIPQEFKWSTSYLDTTLKTYAKFTNQSWESDIIVWPEAAIPVSLNYAKGFLGVLNEKAKQHDATVITGIPAETNQDERYYNAVIALGQGDGTYYKQHLVPFGEYTPFAKLLHGLVNIFDLPLAGMAKGSAQQTTIKSKGINVAPFICYEIAYASTVAKLASQAQLLLTISNDAWFGNSLAPAQHLQIAQMRSLQTGRYQLFTTNDGITAIITPQGKIQSRLPQFKSAVLTDKVYATQGQTPWVKWFSKIS